MFGKYLPLYLRKKIIQRNNIQVGFEFQNITKHACGATAKCHLSGSLTHNFCSARKITH